MTEQRTAAATSSEMMNWLQQLADVARAALSADLASAAADGTPFDQDTTSALSELRDRLVRAPGGLGKASETGSH